jgi:hypothetical protein
MSNDSKCHVELRIQDAVGQAGSKAIKLLFFIQIARGFSSMLGDVICHLHHLTDVKCEA